MSWAKLDDKASEHRKQLRAGADACWLWACSLMYANRQAARDGFIPEEALPALYGPAKNPKRLAEKLVEVGLWEKAPGGWQIHNYHRWNPTAEQVEHERAEGRRRAAESYSRRKASSGEEQPKTPEFVAAKNPEVFGVSSGSTPTPTPTPEREDPKAVQGESEDLTGSARAPAPIGPPPPPAAPAGRGHYANLERSLQPVARGIENWSGPGDTHQSLAAQLGLDLGTEADNFRDDSRSKGRMSCDWGAEFSRWLRRSGKWDRERPRKRGAEWTYQDQVNRVAELRAKAAAPAEPFNVAKVLGLDGPAPARAGGQERVLVTAGTLALSGTQNAPGRRL